MHAHTQLLYANFQLQLDINALHSMTKGSTRATPRPRAARQTKQQEMALSTLTTDAARMRRSTSQSATGSDRNATQMSAATNC
jgi:hypothetical protein